MDSYRDCKSAAGLFSNANVLRAHFLEVGYKPETISTDMPVSSGLLLFCGSDAHDRTTVLVVWEMDADAAIAACLGFAGGATARERSGA
ncbi:MAG: hypothetical protein WB760_28465 [Xanthobacteraceae bacterium]